ncbi:Glycoside Hydrolase Family 78 protein [Tuber magnatum]|uniref:alpha-L-rhamnosidase n=1 Tax=Tuber magnatum TaxID=42249 RepID=A0A317SIB0_9PEZI|nr:Glycoside Hydrolase Family 78 protein [Tuber magnatum]
MSVDSIAFDRQRPTRHLLSSPSRSPALSWKTTPGKSDWQQTTYQIRLDRPDWQPTTYYVNSAASVAVTWPGADISSREIVKVKVAVRGVGEEEDVWSEEVSVEGGLFERDDWSAVPICAVGGVDLSGRVPVTLLRKEFTLGDRDKMIKRARLYVTALGVYEVEINGRKVGDEEFAPGWTSYGHRIKYQTFDVAGLLRKGENAVGAYLGDGWYRGRMGFEGGRMAIYGKDIGLIFQLEITHEDNTVTRVVSDDSWKASTGAILYSEIYDGELYDARMEKPGWSSPGYTGSGDWSAVRELPFPAAALVSPPGPPVRCTEIRAPVRGFTTPSGKTVVDFGQNLVGRLRIKPCGPAGHKITFIHTEVLEKSGEVATRPLRAAQCTDHYIMKGGGEPEVYEPKFTFHGFRYVQVDNWPADSDLLADVEARVLHTDMQRTGWFSCSNHLINRLHQNVVWGMRGNFLEIPTDCPQRDERLGWTGDIHVFSETASFLYDCSGMLQGWLQDLAFEQMDDEHYVPPLVVPDVIDPAKFPRIPQAVWQDVAIVLPWVLYTRFGDVNILYSQLASMKSWLSSGIPRDPATGLWSKTFQFGDWLDPSAPGDAPQDGCTDPMLVANAFLIHVTDLLSQISTILGDPGGAAAYATSARALRQAFNNEYVTPTGRLSSDSQTAYVLALRFNIFPTSAQVEGASRRLAEVVRKSRFRIATGFAGTPYILPTLTTTGNRQLAYRMLCERKCPSWLYPLQHDATTIWERWDGILPDGSINPAEMISFNHYALGAVAEWMHASIGGIAPAAPGWKKIWVAPVPGGEVSWAEVRFLSAYGEVYVRWEIKDARFKLEVRIPGNASAGIVFPRGARDEEVLIVEENARSELEEEEVGEDAGEAGDRDTCEKVLEVGSGVHVFDRAWKEDTDWPPTVLSHPYMPDKE